LKSVVSKRKEIKKQDLVSKISSKKILCMKASLKCYLNLWRKNVAKVKIIKASYVISRAFKKYVRIRHSKKKLAHFFRLYFIMKSCEFFKSIEINLKKMKKLTNACEKVQRIMKVMIFKRLKKRATFLNKLKEIIVNNEEGKYRFLLKKKVRMWKNYKDKDNFIRKVKNNLLKFNEFFYCLFVRRFKERDLISLINLSRKKVNLINPVDKLKSFINLRFMNRLSKYCKLISASRQLKDKFEKAKFELDKQTSKQFLSRILKVFFFKVFKGLI